MATLAEDAVRKAQQPGRARDAGDRRPPRVLILGGGFGGLYAARGLRHSRVSVTLVDRRNYHLFQPLLYQVATAVLNTSDIATPIRRILRGQKNLTVLLGNAQSVDLAKRTVTLTDTVLQYDYLVLATGSTHSYFGHDEWAKYAPGLKTIEDAVEIRRRSLLAFEAAERELNAERRRRLTTFVVVGGGPTGVEMAGALADMGRTLRQDFRNVDPAEVRVLLVEAEDRVLPTFPPELSDKCLKSLVRHGVEVRTKTQLTRVDKDGAFLGDERIFSPNVMWAAGVSASSLGRTLGVETDKAGRVAVDAHLSLTGHTEVFVIGDLAAAESGGRRVPGVAQAAMQGGTCTAENIMRDLEGLPRLPFSYREKGMLATIGRGSAVADLPKLKFAGFPAWVTWLAVHIFFLIGFRNRLLVLAGWLWAYLVKDPGARLITGNSEVRVAQPAKPRAGRSTRSKKSAEGAGETARGKGAGKTGRSKGAEQTGDGPGKPSARSQPKASRRPSGRPQENAVDGMFQRDGQARSDRDGRSDGDSGSGVVEAPGSRTPPGEEGVRR